MANPHTRLFVIFLALKTTRIKTVRAKSAAIFFVNRGCDRHFFYHFNRGYL